MNHPIDQTLESIQPEAILSRSFHRTWFFTNERPHSLFERLPGREGIRNVFAVAGSGDFAFASASRLENLSRLDVADVRGLALLTVDFKIALVRIFSREQISDIFRDPDLKNADAVIRAVREEVSHETREVFDAVFANSRSDNFIGAIRKSGYWYPDGFRKVEREAGYLAYLEPERFRLLREKVDAVYIHAGDFKPNLARFEDRFFDLIYVSNMFDSPRYCPEPDQYLATIRAKLAVAGFVFAVTSKRPSAIEYLFEAHGFKVVDEERHRFNIFKSMRGDFSYSYLVFSLI